VTSAASIDPMVESNRARVLGTFTTQRIASLKGAPTMSEQGIKGLEVPVWVGFLAPAKTPEAVIARLSGELVAACNLPETQNRFRGLGAVSACAGARELDKVVADDYARWGNVIRTAGIKAD